MTPSQYVQAESALYLLLWPNGGSLCIGISHSYGLCRYDLERKLLRTYPRHIFRKAGKKAGKKGCFSLLCCLQYESDSNICLGEKQLCLCIGGSLTGLRWLPVVDNGPYP